MLALLHQVTLHFDCAEHAAGLLASAGDACYAYKMRPVQSCPGCDSVLFLASSCCRADLHQQQYISHDHALNQFLHVLALAFSEALPK
jgi:hypothetical protein